MRMLMLTALLSLIVLGATTAEPAKQTKAQRRAVVVEEIGRIKEQAAIYKGDWKKAADAAARKGEPAPKPSPNIVKFHEQQLAKLADMELELLWLDGKLTVAAAEAKVKAGEEAEKKATEALARMEADAATAMNPEAYKAERRPALQKAIDAAKAALTTTKAELEAVRGFDAKGEF
ncbi:MAG: hypothetical protein FD189_1119 [Elusimicrobia bacterium]|nr:MAG: hypothetical protein FD189_1119 [Elusimicrobiota bacterium]